MKQQTKHLNLSPLLLVILLLTAPILVAQVAWVLHLNYFYLLVAMLVSAAVAGVGLQRKRLVTFSFTYRKDWILLAGAALVLFGSLLPIGFGLYHHHSSSQLLGYEIYGFDDSAHLSLIQNISGHNGLIYKHYAADPTLMESGLTGYPQGWHLLAATTYKPLLYLLNHASSVVAPKGQILVFMAVKLLWFELLGLVMYWLIVRSVRFVRPANDSRKVRVLIAAAAALAVLVIHVTLTFEIFLSGFQPFIGTLIFLMLFMMAVQDLLRSGVRTRTLLAIGLTTLGIAATFFAAMIIVAVVALYGAIGVGKKAWLQYLRRWLAKSPRSKMLVLGGWGLLGLSILFWPAATSVYSNYKDLLNVDGGISPIKVSLIVWLVAISVIGLAYLQRLASDKGRDLHLGLFLAPAVLWAYVGLYQITTTGKLTYYYHKTGEILLLTLMLFVAIVLIRAWVGLAERMPAPRLLTDGVVAVALLLMLCPLNYGLVRLYVRGDLIDVFSTDADRRVLLEVMKQTHATNIVSYFKNQSEDSNFNKLTASLTPEKEEYFQVLSGTSSTNDATTYVTDITKYAEATHRPKVYVIGTQTSLADLQDTAAHLHGKLVLIDSACVLAHGHVDTCEQ